VIEREREGKISNRNTVFTAEGNEEELKVPDFGQDLLDKSQVGGVPQRDNEKEEETER
jgi:hypothetical protein